MARMTEEEADRLDELWTKTTPEIDTSKPGYFTQHMAHLIEVDNVSAAYLRARADASHKTTTQIISELVQEKIAVAL
jgi:predicted HTH transcriptional regulator